MASYVPPPDVAAAAAIEPGTPDRDGPCQGSLHADAAAPAVLQVWTGMRSQKLWARSGRRPPCVETNNKQLMRAKRKQAKADAAAKVPPPPAPQESWT